MRLLEIFCYALLIIKLSENYSIHDSLGRHNDELKNIKLLSYYMTLFFLKQGCDRTAGLAYRTGFMFTALEKTLSTHFANSIYYLSYSPTS